MYRVLVVCTVHNPQRTAPAELQWLLDCLRPDVVFLEHPASDIASFRDGSCGTLESVAVMRYLRANQAELVPVDIDRSTYGLPDRELKAHIDEMLRRVGEASERYRILDLTHSRETDAGGFAYLNSPLGWLREAELVRELRMVVESIGEPGLTAQYEMWVRLNDRREQAMLAGVNDYARKTSFRKGVLLVGAAHRQPLIEKLQHQVLNAFSSVAWEFEWELDDAPAGTGS